MVPMRHSRRFHFIGKCFTKRNLALLLILGLIISGLFLLWASSLELPDMRQVESRRVSQSTKIYDRTGEILLYDLSQNITRTVIPIDQISPLIKNATIAIEDEEFYTHLGVKPTAYMRAIWVDILTLSFSQGGSTITQQVVKNALLTKDKTPARKIKELVLALKVERVLTKDQILEIYLNENPYGGSISGVEEASRSFFGKHASEVSLAEAAYLAALPQAPSYYSPYGNHRKELDQRKNVVLERMLRNNLITKEEYDFAKKEEVVFLPQKAKGILAPHFVFYVQEMLEEKYGSRALEDGGYKVITTLDADLQVKAQEIVKKYALENAEKFNATNASLVAIDPKTGEILVMVGSRNYFDTEIPGSYNIALASRQPGSSFKPFVYAAAFEKGYTPETVLFDVRTQFSTSCEPSDITKTEAPCYSPVNYDDKFRGPISLRNALAQSLNIPSVKLLYLTGINNAIGLAKALGITTLSDANQYGLTLVLGGGEVRLLDMTSAYSTFASNGYRFAPHAILEVDDQSGGVVDKAVANGTQVIPDVVAMQINDVLSDNNARAPSYGFSSALNFPGRDVAVKTGTTNDYKDAWVMGYTPNIVVGTWAGNNDNTSMQKRVAGFILAPLWHEFMEYAISKRPVESFERVEVDISALPPTLRGIWQGGSSVQVDGTEQITGGVHTILHWIDKNAPSTPRTTSPTNDPQYRYWESGVRLWAANNGYGSDQTIILGSPVTHTDPITDTGGQSPAGADFYITSPSMNATVPINEPMFIRIGGTQTFSSVVFSINGQSIGSASQAPFSTAITPNSLTSIKTSGNTLRAQATTFSGAVYTAETTFGTR